LSCRHAIERRALPNEPDGRRLVSAADVARGARFQISLLKPQQPRAPNRSWSGAVRARSWSDDGVVCCGA
jgi:hypothetical protein